MTMDLKISKTFVVTKFMNISDGKTSKTPMLMTY